MAQAGLAPDRDLRRGRRVAPAGEGIDPGCRCTLFGRLTDQYTSEVTLLDTSIGVLAGRLWRMSSTRAAKFF